MSGVSEALRGLLDAGAALDPTGTLAGVEVILDIAGVEDEPTWADDISEQVTGLTTEQVGFGLLQQLAEVLQGEATLEDVQGSAEETIAVLGQYVNIDVGALDILGDGASLESSLGAMPEFLDLSALRAAFEPRASGEKPAPVGVGPRPVRAAPAVQPLGASLVTAANTAEDARIGAALRYLLGRFL